jgi:hypothetical protein
MVVDDLNIVNAVRLPSETNAPLIVHSDAVLTFAITLQCLKPVSRRDTQASELCGSVNLQQLPSGRSLDVTKSSNGPTVEQRFGIGTGERADHA